MIDPEELGDAVVGILIIAALVFLISWALASAGWAAAAIALARRGFTTRRPPRWPWILAASVPAVVLVTAATGMLPWELFAVYVVGGIVAGFAVVIGLIIGRLSRRRRRASDITP